MLEQLHLIYYILELFVYAQTSSDEGYTSKLYD